MSQKTSSRESSCGMYMRYTYNDLCYFETKPGIETGIIFNEFKPRCSTIISLEPDNLVSRRIDRDNYVWQNRRRFHRKPEGASRRT